MAFTYNSITLVGNTGRDADLRYTQTGKAVTGFSMAVSHRYQRNNEWQEETEWFNVSCWGDRWAESVANNIRRGNRVMVVGRLSTREYQARDGATRISLEVSASQIVYLTPKDDQGNGDGGYNQQQQAPQSSPSVYNPNQQEQPAQGYGTSQQAGETPPEEDLENLPW